MLGAAEPRRLVRALVITLGGDRQRAISQHLAAVGGFQVFFCPGVPSRSIRSKDGLREAAEECGLFAAPASDGSGVVGATAESTAGEPSEGHPHSYTFDNFWRDCRSISRQRAVLACLFAHVRALKHARDIPGGVDVVFEDNVRFFRHPGKSAARIRQLQAATPDAVVRLFGFGGPDSIVRELFAAAAAAPSASSQTSSPPSFPFTKFLFSRSAFRRTGVQPAVGGDADAGGGAGDDGGDDGDGSGGPDRAAGAEGGEDDHDIGTSNVGGGGGGGGGSSSSGGGGSGSARGRGVPLVWGCFAYWVHGSVLRTFLDRLRAGLPGSLLSKRNKRQKTFSVRPFDKILYDFGLPEEGEEEVDEEDKKNDDEEEEELAGREDGAAGGSGAERHHDGDSGGGGADGGGDGGGGGGGGGRGGDGIGGGVGGDHDVDQGTCGESAGGADPLAFPGGRRAHAPRRAVVTLHPCCYRAPMLPSAYAE